MSLCASCGAGAVPGSSRKQFAGEKAGRQIGTYSAGSVKTQRTRSPLAMKTAWPADTLTGGP